MSTSTKFCLPLLLVLSLGCSSDETSVCSVSEISDAAPRNQVTAISTEEISEVTVAAVQNMMSDKRFNDHIMKVRNSDNNSEPPVIQCGHIVNCTEDPDLNVSDFFKSLHETGGKTGKFILKYDLSTQNSDPAEAKRQVDRSQPPKMLLVPCVIQTIGLKGKDLVVRRTYTFTVAGVEGVVVWNFAKSIDIPLNARIPKNIGVVDEFQKVLVGVMRECFESDNIAGFIDEYRKRHRDRSAAPVVKLAKIKNATADPEFTNGLVWILQNSLYQTGKFRISAYEGETRLNSLSSLREILKYSDDKGERIPPVSKTDLILDVRIKEEVGENGILMRTYNFCLIDNESGRPIWNWTKALGYKRR
jgi:hypothetical protein